MKRLFALVLCAILLLAAVGCNAGGGLGPAFILNGETLNVYTLHYFIKDEYASVPLIAFLQSIGADYADSPYNAYQVQCYDIRGVSYIYDGTLKVFALTDQYDNVMETLKAQGKTPTKADFRTIDLFAQEGYETDMQAEAWVDHHVLEHILQKTGLDITIEIDRDANAIRVEMPELEENP